MPPWCTCLFCVCWLGNVHRFITRAEPLYDSLNPLQLFCDVFPAVVVCARSLLWWSIKSPEKVTMSAYLCSVCFYICDLNLEVIEKFQANNYRLPHWKKTVPFAHGNFLKFAPEFLVEWYAPQISGNFQRKPWSVPCVPVSKVLEYL